MKTKTIILVGIVCLLSFGVVLQGTAAQAESTCDPSFVTVTGSRINVTSTGLDDTVNLQCALDTAVAMGPGVMIRLSPGTFQIAQVMIEGFHGTLRGSNSQRTVITNLPDLPVGSVDLPPGPDNPWPSLLIFIDSDVKLRNLGIRITGEEPTQAWNAFGDEQFRQLAGVIIVTGTESHFHVLNVSLQGDPSPGSFTGYNAFNGIFFEGFFTTTDVDFAPLAGSFVVTGSEFASVGWPTPTWNVEGATVRIRHNVYKDVNWGVDAGDLVDTTFVAHGNVIEANEGGIQFYNDMLPSDQGVQYKVRNNKVAAPLGVAMWQTIGEDSSCLIRNNNLRNATDTAILLGEGADTCILKANRE